MQILDTSGNELKREPRGLKLRLMDVYKRPGQGSAEFLGELKLLSEADLADFKAWFIETGYPTN